MAKKVNQSSGWRRFALGMTIYAVVFLVVAGIGLKLFWNYMAAYENARPANAVEAYLDALTPEHICNQSQDLIDSIDHNLQSEGECRDYIISQLSGSFTCAKNSKESTASRMVYMIRCGSKVIGKVAIASGEADRYGFTPWEIAEESYDLSYLLGESRQVTIPGVYTAVVNGTRLSADYIINDKVPYEEIAEYYDEYDLPYQVTYEAGPILGELEIDILDTQGNPAELDESMDMSQFFHNCTEAEEKELSAFTELFVKRYVAFTGATKATYLSSYHAMLNCIVRESDLAERLYDALEGLKFGQSMKDVIASIEINHMVRLDEGVYMSDVTYEVDTTGKEGVVRTTTNVRLLVVEQKGSLKVLSISYY